MRVPLGGLRTYPAWAQRSDCALGWLAGDTCFLCALEWFQWDLHFGFLCPYYGKRVCLFLKIFLFQRESERVCEHEGRDSQGERI